MNDTVTQFVEARRPAPKLTRSYRKAGWWTGETLGDWLSARAAEYPDQTAIVGRRDAMSFAETAHRSQALASAFSTLGLGKGDVVAIHAENSPEYLIAHYALARLGAVMTAIHVSYRANEIETILAHGGARAIICHEEVRGFPAARAARDMRDRLPGLEHVISLDGPEEGLSPSLASLMEGMPGAPPECPPRGPDPFLLFYTSGTSDRPKACPLTFDNLLGHTKEMAGELGITADDLILAAGPYSHLYALFSPHLSLCTGSAVLVLPRYRPQALVEIIGAHRPTVMFATPAHMSACLNEGLIQPGELSSLRLAIIAGSAVPPALIRALDERLPDARIVQLWGMTEMQAGLFTRPGDPVEISAESCGRPCPGTEIRIVDSQVRELPRGGEGELQVRGCNVFAGYYGNDEANESSFTEDGWFRTGDLARQDGADNVTISGRIKDIINRGGVKYSTREVEDLLFQHPKIEQVAIVPGADAVMGEIAICFAVPFRGEELALDEICAYLLERQIAKHKLPERLEILAEMPIGPTRKIIKEQLKIAVK